MDSLDDLDFLVINETRWFATDDESIHQLSEPVKGNSVFFCQPVIRTTLIGISPTPYKNYYLKKRKGSYDMILFNVWKEGKNKCVTFSYDDGVVFDRRLIEIFDQYGVKGTFHLNSGLTSAVRIPVSEFYEVYQNHEVAVHGVQHVSLTLFPPQNVVVDIYEDRKALEAVLGKPIVGMSYAYGAYNEEVYGYLKACGIVYSRTTRSTKSFGLPENFLLWHPTCHHGEALDLCAPFLNVQYSRRTLFYIWGHSYEFDSNNNWDLIESVCEKIARKDNVWYATNIEIYDYIVAQKSLRISADNKIIINPTATDVWVTCSQNGVIKIPAGKTVQL